MTPPPRLLARQGELPAGLARALTAAPGEPTRPELQRLTSSLGKALGAPLPVPLAAKSALVVAKGAGSGVAAAGVSAAKPLWVLGAWVMGGLAIGAGLSGVAARFTATENPAPWAENHATTQINPQPSVPVATAAVSEAKPAEVAPPSETSASNGLRAAPSSAKSSDAPAAAAESELSLLKRAEQALATQPGVALALTAKHQALFANGALAQERDVIAIEALLRLGRKSEAAERVQRFEQLYPGSAHTRRLNELVEAKTP